MLLWKARNDFRFITKTLLVIFALSGVSACSSSNTTSSQQATPPPLAKHETYQGPLYQSYRDIQDSSNREKCDQQQSEIQSTLIAALDSKTNDLLNLAYSQNTNTIELSPFDRSYLINKPKITPKKGWQENPYGWGIAYDYYLKHQNDSNPHFWSVLNAYVRSIITDDRKRVVYGYNYSLDHTQIEKLGALKETIEACRTNTRCAQPDWTNEQKQIVATIPAYNIIQVQLNESYFLRTKRTVIAQFADRIDVDYALHQEQFNDLVTHQVIEGKNVYNLPLDAHNFSDSDRNLLKTTIESIWSNDQNQVAVTWKNTSSNLNAFHFLFTYEPDNRSFVNFSLKEIQLYPFNTLRAVGHEIGHVLGFDDHYYTLWDSDKCQYVTQYTEEDIMSVPDSGDIVPSEWQMLEDQYGQR